jgi:uncharacterized repeat protein (TIGR01451 family)
MCVIIPVTFKQYCHGIAFYMKKLGYIFSILAFGLVAVAPASASYGSVACQPVYGGGENCLTVGNLLLNKMVMDPSSVTKGGNEKYVDNLSLNTAKYSAGQTIKFRLDVTNTGNATISTVNVTDILPSYVKFVSGPGSFNKSTNVLSFSFSNLNASETRSFLIVGKIVDNGSLPKGQGTVCTVNQAQATSDTNQSQDNSQFCINVTTVTTKGGLPVYPAPSMNQTPATGAEMFSLLGLLPAAGAGLFLKRKSK